MDSFNALQEELQTQVSNASDQYEQALTLTLTNLNLQLADGAITQEEYDAAVKEATDGYYAQLNEINARVSSFNLETIAEAWDSSLQGYMPEIEGIEAILGEKAADITDVPWELRCVWEGGKRTNVFE